MPQTKNNYSNNQELHAVYFGLSAVLLWSTVAVAFKLSLASATPLQLLFVGTGFSALFFLSITRSQIFALSKKQLAFAACLGILNPFAYYLILFEAYNRLPAHIAQPLNYTWAITLALLAIVVLKQKLNVKQLSGILVSYVGVVVLLTRGDIDNWQQFDLVGVTLALTSTLIWACYWLMNTKVRTHSIAIMAVSFVVGFGLTSVLCWQTESFPALTNQVWIYGAWVGFIEMGFTYWLWQRALSLTNKVARISQLIFLSPIISLVLIAVVLGEYIHWTAIAALGLIIAGIIISNKRSLET